MAIVPNLKQAEELLREYNQEDFHIYHSQVVAGVMKHFAAEYEPERIEFWEAVGLLHDLDFEHWPEQHCSKTRELLEERDFDPELVRAIVSHGYGICSDVEPQHVMEKILFATDELTGLIGAVARMRPSGSVDDLPVKSVMKKFKTPSFAAGCSREVISQGAEMLGWELPELIDKTIQAMRTVEVVA